jgi:hypothetical protein
MAQGAGALAALAVILGVAPLLWRSAALQQAPLQTARIEPAPAWVPEGERAHEPTSPRAQRDGANESTSQRVNEGGHSHAPIRNSQFAIRNSSPEVTLAKAGQGVELAWSGNPSQEFVVYRCTSPKFDPRFGECSVAGVVKGTRWVDSGKETAPVVFYRVEPKA